MDSVEWPAQPVPEPIKKTIERFYRLLDSSDQNAGEKLARKAFTIDAELVVNKRAMCGRERV